MTIAAVTGHRSAPWLAKEGKGCGHCEVGYPITRVESKAGKVDLCLECTLWWFPGKHSDWFEERHLPFLDHIGQLLKRAIEIEKGKRLELK